jgi:predicted ester cyclase
MVDTDNKAVARGFVQAIFNEGKIDEVKNFVTPDIIYHGLEEVKGLENFKQWVAEDRKAFPDMQITIEDAFGEQDKLAMRWNLKGTFAKELHGSQPKQEIPNWKDVSHEKFETQGVEIFHFENGKIKEAWTIFGSMDSFK